MSLSIALSQIWNKIYTTPVRNKSEHKKYLKRINLLARLPENKKHENVVLLIRTDDIGDYLLFRNTLKIYKEFADKVDSKLVLVGNQTWKIVFEKYDTNEVDEVIWLDKIKYEKVDSYFENFNKQIYAIKPTHTFVSAFARSLYLEDMIALASGAKSRIAWDKTEQKYPIWQKYFVNAAYIEVLKPSKNMQHESQLNHEFACRVSHHFTKYFIPEIPMENIPKKNNSVVIFPSAVSSQKRWPATNFIALCNYLIDSKNFDIIINGSEGDDKLIKQILKGIKNKSKVNNNCGNTLLNLMDEISTCKFLVSNDNSAAHIGAITKTTTFVLLNGNAFGRFFPYPEEVENVYPIYTKFFYNVLKKKGKAMLYNWKSASDIQKLKVDTVIKEIDKYV